jgi:hypothetical protein
MRHLRLVTHIALTSPLKAEEKGRRAQRNVYVPPLPTLDVMGINCKRITRGVQPAKAPASTFGDDVHHCLPLVYALRTLCHNPYDVFKHDVTGISSPDGRTFIKAILTHDNGEAYVLSAPGLRASANFSQSDKSVRAAQKICRERLQDTVAFFTERLDSMVRHTVLMALATLFLNEGKCEVDVNKKKLSESAYDFTEWLLQKVDHEELRNFRDKQLKLREQRRLEFRMKNASVSGDSGKPKTGTQLEMSQESASVSETLPPTTDGNESIEGDMHPAEAEAAGGKGKAPSSRYGSTGKSSKETGGTESSDESSFEGAVKRALEKRGGFPNLC